MTGAIVEGSIPGEERMEQERPIFISSCSRRQLARRRPHRSALGLQRAVLRPQLAAMALMAVAMFAVFVALHGGV